MTRSVRLILALLLSFTLPLAGMAGVAVSAQPCPDHQMSSSEMPGMKDSCCDEERGVELGYKVCKMGQENCQTSVMLAAPALKTPIIPCGDAFLARHTPGTPAANAETFWRPPRF